MEDKLVELRRDNQILKEQVENLHAKLILHGNQATFVSALLAALSAQSATGPLPVGQIAELAAIAKRISQTGRPQTPHS